MNATFEIKSIFRQPALRVAAAFAMLAIVFVLPAHAMASSDCSAAGSDPTAAQYCNSTSPPQPGVAGTAEEGESSAEPASEVSAASSAGGSLPFTGDDLLALAAVAAAFVAIGLALQRLSAAGPGTD